MVITPQIEAEIAQLMEGFWSSYFSGDLETFASFLEPDYRNIGTTKEEIWNSRDEIINYTEEVLPQMVGKAEVHNKKMEVHGLDPHVMVHEFGEVHIKSEDGWKHYAEFRISTVIKNVDGKWKVWHQHGSYPDMRAMDGEAFGVDELKAENARLQAAVKKRTAELEQKSRELRVEAALERVRSRSMAMQTSEELQEVIQLVYDEMVQLGLHVEHTGFIIDYPTNDDMHIWLADKNEVPSEISIPYFDSSHWNDFVKAKANGGGFFTTLLSAEETNKFYRELFKHIPDTPEDVKEYYYTRPGVAGSTVLLETVGLYIENFSGIPYTDAENDIVQRFGNVFQQTYTRFRDLQKAEARAREAQVEIALERVRSRTMAMHKSEELREVIQLVFDQLRLLEINIDHCGFIQDYQARDDMHIWLADQNGVTNEIILPYFKCAHWDSYLETKARGGGLFTNQLSAEESKKYYRDMFEFIEGVPEEIQEFYFTREGLAISTILLDTVGLYVENYTGTPLTEAENEIIIRFGKVYQQTYTRFQDLKKAEEQAWESQIEVALERVRSRAMSMRSSDELAELVITVFRELRNLDMVLTRCLLWIFNPEDNSSTVWMTNSEDPNIADSYAVPFHEHPAYLSYLDAWSRLEPRWVYLLAGKIKDMWDEELVYGYFASLPEHIKLAMKEPEQVVLSCSFNKYGCIQTASLDTISDANLNILHRFSLVFEQSYTRFLDLVTAEAQTREAQIELALERIRAHVTAMQESSDILDIVVTMRSEFINLGHEAHYFWHMRWLPDIYQKAMTSGDGTRIGMVMELPRHIHGEIPLLDNWEKGTDPTVVYAMEAEEAVAYVDKMITLGDFQQIDPQAPGPDDIRHIGGLTFIMARTTHGEIGYSLPGPVPDPPGEALDTLVRFAAVFDLAYTRFEDLKQSEKQTREAEIELGLERVRARALAMQQPEELKDVAQVLRHEMGLLGIEALETCSIYLNDGEAGFTECWYAIKDVREEQKAIVADQFSLDLNDTWVGREMLKFYEASDQQTSIIMSGEPRKEWIHFCEEHSKPLKGYYGDVIPDRTYHLYKFSHGALGVATPGDLSEENWGLLRRAASVFSLAYSRFRDLTQARIDLERLKEEKKRAEEALHELKLTQTQLIHAEKMASLGELTAGIAHEIQNPLNFVNNFSDVSRELLEEMIEELKKGDMDEVDAIAADVIQNLEKIVHHGKRADSIVKGMLQHSRSGTGEKQPTDINALVDEYLRLAYHGMRAKEKSFDAGLNTDFDDSIGKINCVPQDIGRVLLNLLTNAFHAVVEKKELLGGEFKPTVSIKTLKGDDHIEIHVTDNGNGIPEHVIDKIFQPFFTTKPTGQGTGLGLSMSYDIVTKGHGGDLKVSSVAGEGTTFVVELPDN